MTLLWFLPLIACLFAEPSNEALLLTDASGQALLVAPDGAAWTKTEEQLTKLIQGWEKEAGASDLGDFTKRPRTPGARDDRCTRQANPGLALLGRSRAPCDLPRFQP